MAADVAVLRSVRERENSAKVQRRIDADLERIKRAAAEIRQMARVTRLYQERLDGKRVDDER